MRERRPLLNFRLYRLGFVPAVLAIVVVMFSLDGIPRAVDTSAPTGAFEGERAALQARQIVAAAPDRTPGSEGDDAAADLVAKRFKAIPAGAVSEQPVAADYDGDEVELRNVILTLPGDSDRTILVIASRDSASGSGAATSAAATGLLIELANALGVTQHERTIVLGSTSGSAAGAAGARALTSALPQSGSLEAIVVISQPGVGEPRAPYVITTSTNDRNGPLQLAQTAEQAVDTQTGLAAGRPSAFTQLARLAFPSGIGDQAPLVAAGRDAVAISSAGERPAAGEDEPSTQTLDAFGRAVLSTVSAVDLQSAALDHGPATRIELSDNLIPGWALTLLALALALPAAAVAVDAGARAVRERLGLRAGLAWAAARSLPFLGALAALYALSLVTLIPRPTFPFDPGQYPFGARSAVALVLVMLAAAGSALLARRLRPSAGTTPDGALAALGVVAVLSWLALWLANPYLALLAVPLAHVWLAAGGRGGARGVGVVLALALAGCLPVVAALVAVANALALGPGGIWTFILMVADGQIGLGELVAASLLAGSAVGALAVVIRHRAGVPAAV